MTLHDAAREKCFEAKIDAAFPYGNPSAATALIKEASGISLNAIFCVLDEICRPPVSLPVSRDRQFDLVREWSSSFEHSLKPLLIRCAEALIAGNKLEWPEAVEIMTKIGQFDGQRAALSVAYFSGDCDDAAGDAALTEAESRIRDAWDERGV